MKWLFNKLFRHYRKEAGAVTVDWVLLTAAVTALAGAGSLAIKSGVTDASERIGSAIADQSEE